MLSVEHIINDILAREGGFSNRKEDRGGPTRYGITQVTLSDYLNREVSVEEVRNLDIELAKEIYETRYYYGPRINTLPEELQAQVLDIAVNSGPKKAISMLQDVLNLAGFECDCDGVLGPQTRKQAQAAQEQMGGLLTNALSEYREHFYSSIVAANPSQSVFLSGWLKRAREFRVEVS